MFTISMPLDFTIGGTRDCRINREPKKSLGATKTPSSSSRVIPERSHIFVDGGLRTFICSDPDGWTDFHIIAPGSV
jgi:hypothetical protein